MKNLAKIIFCGFVIIGILYAVNIKTKMNIFVNYYDPSFINHNTVLVIDKDTICNNIKNSPVIYNKYIANIKPGFHVAYLIRDKNIMINRNFIYVYNSLVIEYAAHELNSEYTRDVRSHFGEFLSD